MAKPDMPGIVDAITRDLIDRGKIIEAGFWGLRSTVIPANAPAGQVDDMRIAFFAGAQHVFGSIMSMLEPGQEATENDLRRMSLISAELDEFIAQFKARLAAQNGHS